MGTIAQQGEICMTDYQNMLLNLRMNNICFEEEVIDEGTKVIRVYQGAYYRKNYYFNNSGILIDVEEEQA